MWAGYSLGQLQRPEAFDVVRQAHQRPLAVDVAQTAQQEPGEAHHAFDDPEHRLNRDLQLHLVRVESLHHFTMTCVLLDGAQLGVVLVMLDQRDLLLVLLVLLLFERLADGTDRRALASSCIRSARRRTSSWRASWPGWAHTSPG